MAALRVRTSDQKGRSVLDFHRCAMLPLRDADASRADDDIDAVGVGSSPDFAAALGDWNPRAYREIVAGPHFAELAGLRDGARRSRRGRSRSRSASRASAW